MSRPDLPPRLSVVVPFHNSEATLDACVRALVAAAADDTETILADDGSTDGGATTLDRPIDTRVQVVRSEVNIGRGPIRNLGASVATGEILVFVDSDVVVHPDALHRIARAFAEDPSRTAVLGSYDDDPADPGLTSRYRNLLHHHTHNTHGPTATHFWTGLGAVRRSVFEQLGGLDDGRWARNMEDVEFGHRIVDSGGRIDLLPAIEGTHLKRFTVRSMVRIDLFNRAIPWAMLMVDRGLRVDPIVTAWPQRLSALGLVTIVASLLALPFVPGSARLTCAIAALAGLAMFIAANLGFLRRVGRASGPGLAVAAVPLHLLHITVAALGLTIGLCRGLLIRWRTPARRTDDPTALSATDLRS